MTRPRKLFIVGCPRSGTSWVRNLLASHPRVVGGPESHLFGIVHGTVAAGDASVDWMDVLDRYDEMLEHLEGPTKWIDRVSLGRLLRQLPRDNPRPALDVADDLVADILDAYLSRIGARPDALLVEKTPNHIFYAGRILRRFRDAVVIEVLRDGRDVCVSLQQRALGATWPPTQREDQIDLWVRAVRQGQRVRSLPEAAGRWLVVRFEQLLTDTSGQVEAIYHFAGLEATPEVIQSIVARRAFTSLHDVGEGAHYRAGRAGDWRTHFDASDKALFRERAGETFLAAGYCFESGSASSGQATASP